MRRIAVAEDLSFSQLVAGFMRVLDGVSLDDVLPFMEMCLDLGVTTVDHADIYGGWNAEAVFGEVILKKRPELRAKMEIVTKATIVLPGYCGNDILFYDTSKEYLTSQVERSLRKLSTDYVDVLLLHRPDPLMDPSETADALDSLIAAGKVRYVGVSNFMPSQIALLQKYLRNRIVTNQVQLSVCFVDPLFDGTMDDALMRKMPLMAWSPLAQGRMFKGDSPTPLKNKLNEVAHRYSVTMDQILYAWIYRCPAEICAINGSFKADRVRSAIGAADIRLSRFEWFEILEASRGVGVP